MHRDGLSQWSLNFVSCHLIALGKCPGVRPIGVVRTCRRIVGEAVLATVKMDILKTAGPLQLCRTLAVRLQYMQCVQCSLRKALRLFCW